MRVGLVCPYSLDVHGGVQGHVLALAAELQAAGHHVAVLAPGEGATSVPPFVTTTGRAVPMPYNGSVARVAFGPLVAARVRRWLATGAFDVVHIHEPATPSVSVLALWAAQAPVVATFHTAQERPLALQTGAATLLRGALAKIDAHIAVSEEARRTMARYLGAEAVVIPNGVRLDRFSGPQPDPVGGEAPRARLVFVGRLDEPRKGLDVLLRALPDLVRRVPATRLTLVGAGSPRSLARLPQVVLDRVEVAGVLDEEQKANVLAAADVLVAPNTHGESFGVVLLEGLAAGTPVAASDLPAFSAVLSGGRHGALFRTGDPADLARVVAALLDDEPGRRRFAAAGREVAARYDWESLVPRIAGVYAAVARRSVRVAAG